MLPLKIGIQLSSLRLPLKQAIAAAAQLGADAVEIDVRTGLSLSEATQTALRQLRKLLDDLNLRVSAVAYPTRRGYGTAEELDRRVEGTKAAMRLAHALGTAVVVNRLGPIPAESDSASWNILRQVLTDLGDYGQRVGAMLAAQTGPEGSEPLGRLIEALGEGILGVDLAPAALVMHRHDPLEAIERLRPHLLHVHLADATIDPARGYGIEVPLGRGSIDVPELLAALEEADYRGYFTLSRDTADDPLRELGQAVQYLRRL